MVCVMFHRLKTNRNKYRKYFDEKDMKMEEKRVDLRCFPTFCNTPAHSDLQLACMQAAVFLLRNARIINSRELGEIEKANLV